MKENFKSMDSMELQLTNGGGFAHDVGRILRFISLAGPYGQGMPYAVADWIENSGEV